MTEYGSKRRVIALGLLVVHCAALVIISATPSTPMTVQQRPLMVATAVAEVQVPPLVSLEPKVQMVSIAVEAPQFETSVDAVVPMAAPPAAGGCGLTEAVQAALGASPAVKAALALVPASAQSVSGATLLWDDKWADERSVGGDQVLTPIKAIVVATVRAASADCQSTTVTGPRLVFITDVQGMRILAFGSGTWKWSQQLLDSPQIAAATAVKMSQSQ